MAERILALEFHKTARFRGRDHDFKTYRVKHPAFPTGLPDRDGDAGDKPGRDHLGHYTDTAYLGMNKLVKGMDVGILPPTSGNTADTHLRIRIRVKNAIRRTIIFRIVREKYRNDQGKYDRIIRETVCGAANQTALTMKAGQGRGRMISTCGPGLRPARRPRTEAGARLAANNQQSPQQSSPARHGPAIRSAASLTSARYARSSTDTFRAARPASQLRARSGLKEPTTVPYRSAPRPYAAATSTSSAAATSALSAPSAWRSPGPSTLQISRTGRSRPPTGPRPSPLSGGPSGRGAVPAATS